MKTKRFILMSILFFVIGLFHASMANAATSSIECNVPRIDKIIKISGEKVSIHKIDEITRKIASVSMIRSQKSMTGITKIMSHQGHKYTIHINDTKNFSEVDDFVSIRSKKGHEITYPLICNLK